MLLRGRPLLARLAATAAGAGRCGFASTPPLAAAAAAAAARLPAYSVVHHTRHQGEAEDADGAGAGDGDGVVVSGTDAHTWPARWRELFAVVAVSGTQHRVMLDDVIVADRLRETEQGFDIGQEVDLPSVLMLGSRSQTVLGRPLLHGAKVRAVVEEHVKEAKKVVFKMRRRKKSRRKRGFRRRLSMLRVIGITHPDEFQLDVHAATEAAANLDAVAMDKDEHDGAEDDGDVGDDEDDGDEEYLEHLRGRVIPAAGAAPSMVLSMPQPRPNPFLGTVRRARSKSRRRARKAVVSAVGAEDA